MKNASVLSETEWDEVNDVLAPGFQRHSIALPVPAAHDTETASEIALLLKKCISLTMSDIGTVVPPRCPSVTRITQHGQQWDVVICYIFDPAASREVCKL